MERGKVKEDSGGYIISNGQFLIAPTNRVKPIEVPTVFQHPESEIPKKFIAGHHPSFSNHRGYTFDPPLPSILG